MDFDLITPWNKLVSLIPSGVQIAISVIGITILVFAFLKWAWQRRRGGADVRSYPWMMTLFGVLLVSPTILFPMVVLPILQVVITLFARIVEWFVQQMG